MLIAAMVLAQALPAQPDVEKARAATIASASVEIANSNPAKAIAILDPLIADVEAESARRSGRTYCAMSGPETIAYLGTAAGEKKSAVAINRSYCDALFLKGYSLIDLNRIADGRAQVIKAISFAPMHAHFIVELGQTYRLERDWDKMLSLCRSAVSYAGLAGEAEKLDKGLALRCVGYALVEQGKWDEAEEQYRECLRIDPNDVKARGELRYIAEQRHKQA